MRKELDSERETATGTEGEHATAAAQDMAREFGRFQRRVRLLKTTYA